MNVWINEFRRWYLFVFFVQDVCSDEKNVNFKFIDDESAIDIKHKLNKN
jgi:hypothetical protein